MIAKMFRIYNMTISQNNIIEYSASSEVRDIIIAFNLRENSILDISMLNILEKKLVKKKIVDVFKIEFSLRLNAIIISFISEEVEYSVILFCEVIIL